MLLSMIKELLFVMLIFIIMIIMLCILDFGFNFVSTYLGINQECIVSYNIKIDNYNK